MRESLANVAPEVFRRLALAHVKDLWLPGLSIRPADPHKRFSLRSRGQPASDAASWLRTPLNSCCISGDTVFARLGPDEWLIFGSEPDEAAILRDATRMQGDAVFALTEISHRNVGIIVSGPHACEALNGGCPLDLDDQAFPAGSATRTLFGKTEVILLRPTDERLYWIECWRSFAPYVHALLIETTREFADARSLARS
jgi:sarcosine oxidase, subunit gamma